MSSRENLIDLQHFQIDIVLNWTNDFFAFCLLNDLIFIMLYLKHLIQLLTIVIVELGYVFVYIEV